MIRAFAFIAFYDLILTLAQVDYVCRPYFPTEQCEDSRYEFTVRDITEKAKPEIAHGTAKCVVKSGRFIVPMDGTFSVRRLQPMAEPFERLSLPAKQTYVCKWD